MISVIICSANEALLNQVSKNIKATIGVPCEIIAIDNSLDKQGICSVYNKGILLAKYDTLCFMHEDVLIKTGNWGQTIVSLFQNDPRLGLVGVAGSSYKPLTPSVWGGRSIDTTYINLIQSFKYKRKKAKHVYRNPHKETLSSVACVDGVWLCTTKNVVKEFRFDDATFKGFHGYDIDFSLSVGQKYKVAVTFEVLLEHFSEGFYDKNWMKENLILHNKWFSKLPCNVENIDIKQILHIEKLTFKHLIDQLMLFKLPLNIALKALWRDNRFLRLNPKLFFKLNFHTVKRLFIAKKIANY